MTSIYRRERRPALSHLTRLIRSRPPPIPKSQYGPCLIRENRRDVFGLRSQSEGRTLASSPLTPPPPEKVR